MYDVSNFQFLTAVPVNAGETWSGADYIQSNCVLVWSKVMKMLNFHPGKSSSRKIFIFVFCMLQL